MECNLDEAIALLQSWGNTTVYFEFNSQFNVNTRCVIQQANRKHIDIASHVYEPELDTFVSADIAVRLLLNNPSFDKGDNKLVIKQDFLECTFTKQ